jgi:FAD/FMN-containing dehydrogenase
MNSPPEQFRPSRRCVLAAFALAPLVPAPTYAAAAGPSARVRPGSAEWPDPTQWAALSDRVGGRLEPVRIPNLPELAPKLLANPFFLRDQPGLTQSSGFVDAWRSAPSTYVVRARDAADVAAAIQFAAGHNLRLVVRGGGHSYLGGSNAPDSLLIWTRDLESITLHDAFTPQGSPAAPIPAVSVGAGCIWLDVYRAVTTQDGRYVQGGGCITVGVAGLVQGGGFGSFSKAFGLAAASLLEAEIVTADGAVRTVNTVQEPDLFWALKGGGGGTFGVVARLTLRTHVLPSTFGFVHWSLGAASDAAFRRLLDRFIALYAERLFNPHWGEQASAKPSNRFEVLMLFQGLDEGSAREAWSDFVAFVTAHPDEYEIESPLRMAAFPANRLWDEAFLRGNLPSAIATDDRPSAKTGNWWWAGNSGEAGAFWHGYQSAWLPATLLSADRRAELSEAWFQASRHWPVALHFNKGLAGAPAEALAASRNTAMNPEVLDAFALAIMGMDGPTAYLGLTEADLASARDHSLRIRRAIEALRQVAPGAGCYLSECDYGLADWQRACWGEHWARLSTIKQHYDPDGLFIVHHGVGSERWSLDGFTRAT